MNDETTERQKQAMELWWRQNRHYATSSAWITGLIPELGSVITVNGISIPAAIFQKEYKEIFDAYYDVMNKIKTHDRNTP